MQKIISKTQKKKFKKQYKKEKDTGQQIEKVGNGIISSGDSIYADYIKETLIPAYGISAGGRFSIDFSFDILTEEDLYGMQKPPGVFGIHSILETDLDGDGVSELVVVRIASEDLDKGLYSEHLYVHVFRKDGDQVIELQQPKRIMRYGIMRIIYSGNLDIFVKEENGEKYKLILRLKVGSDPIEYKNSIMSFWCIGETTWKKNLKNKKVLYRRE